ncbi:glucuronate isomerase [Actinotalea ferrariae CF5-4]|uniref:Uronate isomerase n=1 Tax=Actinotalea ferrariae CF5-4 TaxID=948458 RepID=A0A021W0T8_9CELL|nr:glucuronate isomerase [Actinotalea ferrariae]EYR64932.1 glucuronate isomerase [Actinotalea ferrariae CF5-4]
MAQLDLHPDRLLPTEPGVRAVAREVYAAVKDLPIVSPHGHVPAGWLADDVAFADPTSLLITPDHYVTRLLHAHGVALSDLGVGRDDMDAAASRAAFRTLCAHWPAYRGTVVKTWFEAELVEVFGVDVVPSAQTADAIYDRITEQLATPQFRARALYERFGIEVLATTDDPCDDLADHRRLAEDPAWSGRVIPTFRPDRYLEPAAEGWNAAIDLLGRTAGTDVDHYSGWVEAMEARRAYFREHGATSTDHSHRDVRAEPLDRAVAEELYLRARKGDITPDEGDTLRRDLVFQMARMAADDGLVMTLHPAVARNHHGPSHRAYGADVGADIPTQVEFTRSLQPVLEAFGTHPGFQIVLFTIDETVYSRELAPLAGFYPSVYIGAPWWFIDAPDAMQRFRAAVTETAGFARTSGFIDDTRAFLSIPARHDVSRRVDAGFLARLVAEHRLTTDEAIATAHDLVLTNPKRAFRL